MKPLTWEDCKPGAPSALIADVEAQLGVKFPDDFRALVQTCQGGTPVERSVFPVRIRQRTMTSGLGALLPIETISDDLTGLRFDDQIPDGVIPFAEVGNGDFICFDYRNADADAVPVAYWDHGKNKDESVFPLAPTFAAFLDMLEPSEPLP
jgi:hypothetical protein